MVDLTKIQSKVPAGIFTELVIAMPRFEINTPLRVSHFLAQAMEESMNFTHLSELLNYSSTGLRGTFPKYFPDDATANAYAHQPEKIANRVYANRYGNKNEVSGDGFLFRGRGIFQLTFRDNYIAFGNAIGEDIVGNPDLLLTPKYAALSACWFFASKGLSKIADEGSDDIVVQKITKKINGGLNGISVRIKNFKTIYSTYQPVETENNSTESISA